MTAAASPDVAAQPVTGWVKVSTDPQAWNHWAVGGQALCGAAVPVGAQVVSDRGVNPNAGRQVGPWVRVCRACQSEVLRLAFDLPFRVGQRVVSRSQGMTLRGVIADIFLDLGGQPQLNITRDHPRPPLPDDREMGLELPTDWYRSPAECALLEDKMTATEPKTPRKGSKKAAPSATPEPAPVQASVERPVTFDLGPLQAGDYVIVRTKGTATIGGILRRGDEAGTWHVLTREGEAIFEKGSLEGRDDYPPAVPLRVGDRVMIQTPERRHQRFEVLQEVALNDTVPLRNLGGGEDHPGILARGVRVVTRTRTEDLYADLSLTKFLPAAPEPAEVPVAQEVAPALAEAPFAVGQEVEFVYPFPTENVWTLGTITKVYGPEETSAYRKDFQIKSGKAFYYRVWQDVRLPGAAVADVPMQVSEATTLEQVVVQDPGVAAPVLEVAQEATASVPVAEGWMFPNGSHLAHWGDGTKVLCGRMVPEGTAVEADSDPSAYQEKTCRKCRAALTRQATEIFAKQVGATYRVYARFPDGTEGEGTVYSGKPHPYKGTYGVRRDGDGLIFELEPAALEVRPALRLGDRVWIPGSPSKAPGVITGDYSHEGKPFSVKIRHGDGTDGGGHIANLVRAPAAVQETPPLEVAPAEAPAPEQPKPAFEIPHFDPVPLGLQAIPWNKILPSTLNPRKKFDPVALRELAISIHAKGLQQNLVARPHPERHGMYELAAGERRYRAIGLLTAGFAGEGDAWLEVPQDLLVSVLVQDLDDLALLEIATSENVHRNNFSPLEEADAYAALLDHGATVDGLHDRFGLGKRTIQRRVQIARHLIPELRELYENKKLALNQAEVLALATPSVQAGLLRSHLRHSAQTSPADLRKLISERVFLVSRAQFPRAWYKGKTVSADLFGELGEHFADFDEALGCQVRHAVALAKKDVEKGAPCAEVREGPEAQLYSYIDSPDGGPVYWVNSTTGDLKRYENKRLRTGYDPGEYYFERARVVSTHETPASAPVPAPASAPATPTPQPAPEAPQRYEAVAPAKPSVPPRDSPTYPDPYLVGRWGTDQALLQAAASPQFLHALVILDALDDGWSFPAPAHAACRVLAEASDGALRLDVQGDLCLPEDPTDLDVPETLAQLRAALRALEAAPAEALATVFTFRVLSGLRPDLTEETREVLVERQPFVLTEVYLKACNHEALLEMWASAGLPEEPNAGDEYLRAMLLEEATVLAARGWLPLPLAREAAARSAHEIPFEELYSAAGALLEELSPEQMTTVVSEMGGDPTEYEPEALRQALLESLGDMETDHIRTWSGLWQFRTIPAPAPAQA